MVSITMMWKSALTGITKNAHIGMEVRLRTSDSAGVTNAATIIKILITIEAISHQLLAMLMLKILLLSCLRDSARNMESTETAMNMTVCICSSERDVYDLRNMYTPSRNNPVSTAKVKMLYRTFLLMTLCVFRSRGSTPATSALLRSNANANAMNASSTMFAHKIWTGSMGVPL